MPRPMKPQGLKRVADGAKVEAMGAQGNWVPLHVLRPESVDAIVAKFGKPDTWPADAFEWVGSRPVDMEDTPAPQTTHEEEDMTQPQQEQPQQEQQDDQPQPQPQPQPQQEPTQQEQQDGNGPTLDDIVRRIADRLDAEREGDMMAWVEDQLATLQVSPTPTDGPTDGPTPYLPVTVRVEVRTPTQVTAKDGLFHHEFATLAHLVSIGQHVYLPGPPGSGKSYAAKQVADLLGYQYAELSMSPDMPESRMWGGRTADGYTETPLLAGLRYAIANPDRGFVQLIDEMDAGRPGLIISLNNALANQRVQAPNGDMLEWGDNVVFIGGANTFGTGPTAEFSGRNKLDPASLNRFMMLPWDTDPIMEQQVVRSYLYDDKAALADAWLDAWTTLRNNVKSYGLKTFVTMRGAKNGARALASGLDLHKTMMLTIGNSIPADQWAKVNPL